MLVVSFPLQSYGKVAYYANVLQHTFKIHLLKNKENIRQNLQTLILKYLSFSLKTFSHFKQKIIAVIKLC